MGACPKVTKADTECHKPPPARTPLPMKLMMSLMFATGVFITSCMIFIFVCLHTVKNDNWVYGRDHKKYAEVKGSFDFKCLFPCLYKKKKKLKLDRDRAKDARE